MKRSKVLMVGAVVGAVSLFTVTALASTPNTAGYDAFKEVVKANQQKEQSIESATVNSRFIITMDGETILTANGTTKMQHKGEEHVASSDFDFTLMGVERTGSVYGSEESAYFVDRTHDKHYQVINLDNEDAKYEREWNNKNDRRDRSMSKAEEALLDYMVGDLKNEFSVANHADGTRTITVDVSKDEIPLPLKLMIDVAASKDRNERDHNPENSEAWDQIKHIPFFQGLEELNMKDQLPDLKNDVAIERVQLQMTVDANNELQHVEGELEVSGKDEAGDFHRVQIDGTGEISGLNATTPDVYDPAGKSIEIIDAQKFDDHN
jgi:hypothetical protein